MKQFSILSLLLLLLVTQSCTKSEETQDQQDQKLIQQYLKANNITNAQSTASGLHYIIEDQGTGQKPNADSKIEFFYVGKLLSGQIFDSNESITIALNQLIAGFREGIPLINESGKITLIVPSSLGYGSQGSALIPANSVLIFNVELIAVLPD